MAVPPAAVALGAAVSAPWQMDGTINAFTVSMGTTQNAFVGTLHGNKSPLGRYHPIGVAHRQNGYSSRGVPVERRQRSGNSGAVVNVSEEQDGLAGGGLPLSVEYISSPSNPYVKHLVRLRQSAKARNAAASVLVVGTVPLQEICECVAEERSPSIDVLLLKEGAQVQDTLARQARRIVRVSSPAMSRLSGLDSPPDAAGVLGFPSAFAVLELPGRPLACYAEMRKWCTAPRRILVLDAIQDPGNIGTLLRTASAFAWDGVFLLHGCCDPFNDKALRAARGASFRLPIATGSWNQVREFALTNDLKLYAGVPESDEPVRQRHDGGPSPYNGQGPDLPVQSGENLCLVLGSEGQGLSDAVSRDCSPIEIPMPGKFESLNVAVAGGILMFMLR